MAEKRRPHAVAWIRSGFAVVEAIERAEEENRHRTYSGDPHEAAEAALATDSSPAGVALPASGDWWGVPTLSFVLPEELRDRGGPLPSPAKKVPLALRCGA